MATTVVAGAALPLLSLIGMYSAYLYGRHIKKFRWSEYCLLLIVPVASCLGLSYLYGIKVIYLFLLSSIIGFAFEYLFGLTYHKTLNHRLWHYNRFSIGGYTSPLAIPMWGVAGVIFWLLSKGIGL